MGERERILELVRDGILSVDEGLDLLESLAKRETNQSEKTDFTSESPVEEPAAPEKEFRREETVEEDAPFEEAATETEADDTAAEERQRVEEELETLANEMNQYSAEIDGLNEELTDLKTELADVETELADRKADFNEAYVEDKKELEHEIINLQKQIELISMIEEVDSSEELQALNKDLTRAMEDLQALENKVDHDETIKELETQAEALRAQVKEQTDKKNAHLKELHSLKMKQWTTKAKQVSENMDIPEEWRESANKTFHKASDIFEETSKTLGDVFRQTLKTTKDALDNVDWKDIDINLNIPRGAKVEFEHEWLFEDTTATILDFKNANGHIQFKPSVNDNIKVNAKIGIRGDVDEANPLATFEANSVIKIDEDKFTFHSPNKNVTADMIVYLPQRNYDYIRSNSFNGDVAFYDVTARDVYVKATNGDIVLENLEATMLEVKGTNGDITLKEANLRDQLLNTVNGDVRVVGVVQSSDVNTTNGVIRITLSGDEIIRVAGSSVNGDVKISLPATISLEIEARSTFGKIKSRLANTDILGGKEGKAKHLRFRRVGSGDICRVNAQTTTGNVLLKDTE